ncbi:MAG TPA: glycosyltransferase [Flavobacterium sp.]|jgi:glycosyltransferase involved in cell wall biosynthesis
MSIVFILIFVLYLLTILALNYGYTRIKVFKPQALIPKNKFSIIVPFRNEAGNLPQLLDSFSQLNYAKDSFEVVLVDDASSDGFELSDYEFKVVVLNNRRTSNSPKKDAIVTAMEHVAYDWVITTDADCVVHKNWLVTLDAFIQQKQPEMVAGPVAYTHGHSFLDHFQQLDLASLQGATIGSFGLGKGFMCNGANLVYTKSLFMSLNGFKGNDGIASGDDVFLLQKAMAKYPEKVAYLKSESAIVTTQPVKDWKSLFYQRVRWASKTTRYQSGFGKILGLIVFSGNLCWILGFGFWVLGYWILEYQLLLTVLKFVVDGILIVMTNRFLKKPTRFLILSSLLYPVFSVVVALYSIFGKYEWKGRRF